MNAPRTGTFCLALGVALVAGSVGHAQQLPTLVTGGSVAEQPGTTFNVNVQLTNLDQFVDVEDFTAFFMGFQLIPQSGAVGTLTIIGASQPATSPVLTESIISETFLDDLVLPNALNGTTDYVGAILGNDPETGDSIGPGQTLNMVTLQIQASGDADGLWRLFAVNDSDTGNPVSAWQKAGFGTDYGFTNLPSASPTALELTVISVPEPSARLLASVAGGIVGCYATLRGRRTVNTLCLAG
jgi:hypothetical protein